MGKKAILLYGVVIAMFFCLTSSWAAGGAVGDPLGTPLWPPKKETLKYDKESRQGGTNLLFPIPRVAGFSGVRAAGATPAAVFAVNPVKI